MFHITFSPEENLGHLTLAKPFQQHFKTQVNAYDTMSWLCFCFLVYTLETLRHAR